MSFFETDGMFYLPLEYPVPERAFLQDQMFISQEITTQQYTTGNCDATLSRKGLER